MEKRIESAKIIKRLILTTAVILLSYFVIRYGNSVINRVVEFSAENLFLTTVIILFLFFIKSVSFGLPYTLLYIGVSQIYPLFWALVINSIGIIINGQIPYFLGRYGASSLVDKAILKYPKLKILISFKTNNSLLFAFLVKFLGIVPHEITNLMLGSLKIGYFSFLFGSLLGLAPGMVITTVAGNNLTNPLSWPFVISVILLIVLLVFSYYIYKKLADESK
ncbi:MAG: VTT domain-containing protein [Sphaerochaetaceae bacterium]